MAEYLTIAEFAKQVDRSRQYIYSEIDKDYLQPFLRTESVGKTSVKKISTDAINFFPKTKRVKQTVNDSQKTVDMDKNLSILQLLIDSHEREVMSLKGVIKVQQEEIAQLHAALSAQQSLLDQQQNLLDQQQQLELARMKQLPAAAEDTVPAAEPEEKRTGFFKRLFG